MASTGKDYQEEIETLTAQEAALRARTSQLQVEQEQAKKMLAPVEEARRSKINEALDSIKKRYFHRLLGGRGVKVLAPRVSGVEETTLGKVTTIPKIVQRNLNEIEIQPILKNYSYVRILYDTMANEYFYEAFARSILSH